MGADLIGWRNCDLQKPLGPNGFLQKLKMKSYLRVIESQVPEGARENVAITVVVNDTQRELTYLVSLFFVAFLYPARLLAGWAMGRSLKHHSSGRPMTRTRFILSTFMVLPATAPVILFYVFILWVSQYTAWFGPASLLVQHAFMVPVPFLGV